MTLAGELLDRRESHPVFVPLVQAYPESFHPHLARVLAWPNEWKELLKELGWRRWSEIARGASDPLVDAMAETTRRLGDRAPELELLLAADTPRALMRLADLARELPHVHEIATKRGCLEIPARGPAVRRFDPNQSVLHVVPRDNMGDCYNMTYEFQGAPLEGTLPATLIVKPTINFVGPLHLAVQ